MSSVIIINGYPAVGKTTLMRRLAFDLSLPAIGKDEIKEFLFDTLKVKVGTWSAPLGGVSSQTQQSVLATAITLKQSIIIENSFITAYAQPELQAIVRDNDVQVIEVYCKCTTQERLKRWNNRIETGQRHEVHIRDNFYVNMTDEELASKYGPLQLGELIQFDTTTFAKSSYDRLLSHLRRSIAT